MKKLLMITMALVLSMSSAALGHEWKIDPNHAAIMFEIKHIYSATRGHFNDFEGTVFFDPAQPEKSRAEFTVKVDSIYTAIPKRDNHLRSNDFFATKKYPEMTFTSTRVVRKNGNRYLLEGDMTVKDVTKRMQLEFVFLGERQDVFNKGRMVGGFDTRFTIDRLAFNVGNGKFVEKGVIGQMVDVYISLEMTRKK
jgi:polyisoprenoid-binding protein YceI